MASTTLEIVSEATSPIFRDIAGAVAILVIVGLPVYLIIHLLRSSIGE